jgi:protein-S-isoprenylcysteine O-methyltransferase Ste14
MSTPGSSHRFRRFTGNYLSTLAFIGISWWIVSDLSEFHRSILQAQWRFGMFEIDAVLTARRLFLLLIGLYAVVLVPFYLKYPWLHSKAFVFLQGVGFSLLRMARPVSRARQARMARTPMRLPLKAGLSPAARQAALALLLKFFFAPLMINWCLGHAGDLGNSLLAAWNGIRQGMAGRALFDSSVFWACFQLILFVDTLLFTLGYIVEMPALRNRIRSVDPTFFGWAVCLACYPPFNDFTGRFLQWQSSDFPQFQNDAVHFAANISLLAALTVYSWASVALAFKASNLTNRGIVSHGPYALVRHPAYAAKNLAWWIGALPNLYAIFASGNLRYGAYALLSLSGWTLLYVLRAITEERHLLMGGNGYAEYTQRVRWRFIPRII